MSGNLEKSFAELIFMILGSYLFLMDFKYLRLPDTPVFILLWAGLFININHFFSTLDDAVLGVILGYGSLWMIFWGFKYWTGKEGLGYGDFKLLGALGAWFGWEELPRIILISSSLGLVVCAVMGGVMKLSFFDRGRIPFGPLILLAGFLEFFK